ncbi:restriction endonuclease, partial [Halorientalis persicus]
MKGERFEQVLAHHFRNQGFDTHLTKATADKGIDILLKKK